MRYLFFLIVFYCLSCTKMTKESDTICFYYTKSNQDEITIDTIQFKELNQIDSLGDLLATQEFKLKNTYHQIKMFSTDRTAPIDGGELYYTLDNKFCIYNRSTCWPSFGMLSCNNDSLNELINVAIGNIIMHPSLRCHYCDDKYTHAPKKLSLEINTVD